MNRDTHAFAPAHTATLTGWRRVWRHTILRPVAYLSVEPDPACRIDGLIAAVPGDDWAALDKREGAYDRTPAAHQVTHPLPHDPEIAVYTIADGKYGDPDGPCQILLSYIDVVVKGYLREYGEAGVIRFFDTTDGWDTLVIDDRANPAYPRHQTLTSDERAFVNDLLRDRDVRVTDKTDHTPNGTYWPDS